MFGRLVSCLVSGVLVCGCTAGSGGTPGGTPTPTPTPVATSSGTGTRLVADGVGIPMEIVPLAPATPFHYLGKVIGWTATFGMPRGSLEKNLADVGRTLAANGWNVSPNPARNSISAVRHAGARWELLDVSSECPAPASGACIMTLLYVHRPA